MESQKQLTLGNTTLALPRCNYREIHHEPAGVGLYKAFIKCAYYKRWETHQGCWKCGGKLK